MLRLETRGLGKDFPMRDGRDTAARVLRRLAIARDGAPGRIRALVDVSFEVRAGEMVGVVGNNGAGKTTLLKLIAGIYRPSRGTIERRGALALLSGLGVGMVPDLTVGENVYLYGAICRLHRTRIRDIFDEIIAWAELGDFVSAPLRTLSTGMTARLAFSIARHTDAPILLLDEALTAGDERFRHRCEEHFAACRGRDRAMLMSSHSLELIERFCERTLWLRSGEQMAFGETPAVLAAYRRWAS
jgi:ABC-type polysaccharide/polyol phosphate transport system ATPase subunit